MLRIADIVSINAPHTEQTQHLIDARRLALLGSHAYLINTARGEIIDEAALIEALEHGRPAGAGLDAYEREPAVDARLLAPPTRPEERRVGNGGVSTCRTRWSPYQ